MALLELRDVSRTFDDRIAVATTDLDVAEGTCVALLGPNGSGKSTLLRIAAGRDSPTTGTVRLAGHGISEDDPRVRSVVAVAGDGTAFYPDLTVHEHLDLVALAHGAGNDAEDDVVRVLAALHLTDAADQFPGTLSSGQRQAMMLGAALVRPRQLLILDEPEQRLDPGARSRLADLLRAEAAAGCAVLFATHHAELARAVADHAVLLDGGAVVASGRPEDVLSHDLIR